MRCITRNFINRIAHSRVWLMKLTTLFLIIKHNFWIIFVFFFIFFLLLYDSNLLLIVCRFLLRFVVSETNDQLRFNPINGLLVNRFFFVHMIAYELINKLKTKNSICLQSQFSFFFFFLYSPHHPPCQIQKTVISLYFHQSYAFQLIKRSVVSYSKHIVPRQKKKTNLGTHTIRFLTTESE